MSAKRNKTTTTKRLELDLQFGRGTRIAPLSETRLRQLIRRSLQQDLSLNLRFVGRNEALQLNKAYRKRRYVPNVLTFEYPDVQAADVVICTPIVREQAKQQHKSFEHHLSHMVVHAVLHAQGYQHSDPAQASTMESLERQILAKFGISDPYVLGDPTRRHR